MCSPATCSRCNKVTWSGCGQHVDDVMRNVPQDRQCTCDSTAATGTSGSGFLGRLFGR